MSEWTFKTADEITDTVNKKLLSERSHLELSLDILKELGGQNNNPVEGNKFIEKMVSTNKISLDDAKKMLQKLNQCGAIYEVKPDFYRKL